MAISFPDRTPTASSNDKDVHIKVIQLTFADFTTGGANSVKAVLPADSTILNIGYWKKTAFSGNGITAATVSVGIPSAATTFVSALDVHTPAVGTNAEMTPITNIMQGHTLPIGADIPLLFTGTATTGNPTAGELYVRIWYVR